MFQKLKSLSYKTVNQGRESDWVFMYVINADEQMIPDADSGVVRSVTFQSGSGSFNNTLVCRRHRNDCAIWKEQRGGMHFEA